MTNYIKEFCGLCFVLMLINLTTGAPEHIHLKIHLPEIHQRNTHVKTKYIHMYHPKIVHHDHQSFQYHSRRDPDNKELRVTENEYLKWREMQLAKENNQQLLELQQQKLLQQHQLQLQLEHNLRQNEYADGNRNNIYLNNNNDNDDDDDYEDNHYKNFPYDEEYYKPEPSRKVSKKSKNDKIKSYSGDRTMSRPKNEFADYDKPFKPSQYVSTPEIKSKTKKQFVRNYGFVKPVYEDAEASVIRPQYTSFAMKPSAVVTNNDPGYYKTLPSDQEIGKIEDNQDDIYSGLISNRYTANVKDKTDTLSNINYNRKQQTKNIKNKTRNN